MKKTFARLLRENKGLLLFLSLMFVFRSAVADWNFVPSGSMYPTLLVGDEIFVNKLAYDLKVPFTTTHIARWAEPQRGDIGVFYSPEDDTRLVKRVVGVPGDVIAMVDNRLIVNGRQASYAAAQGYVAKQTEPGRSSDQQVFLETIADDDHPMMETPARASMRSFGPVLVPADKYLMLGDNRDNSKDSRYIGMVERDRIVGRTQNVLVSWNAEHYYLPRAERFWYRLP